METEPECFIQYNDILKSLHVKFLLVTTYHFVGPQTPVVDFEAREDSSPYVHLFAWKQ